MSTPPGTRTEPRHREVISGGVPLSVHQQGDPDHPVVVLVHGYPDTHRVWDDVAAALADDHHVVRYDVRGAGESGQPAGRQGYRLDQLAEDLFAVIQAVSPDRPVHVVAHDWGSIQSWEAVTDPRAHTRVASYTTISGPCLDHIGYWIRHRLARPVPRHLAQLLTQAAHSWYIAAFHLPALAPAVWRHGLADRWPTVLERIEDVPPRPGHPQPTLREDAVRGINLYRANMLPRLTRPRRRPCQVPVQLLGLTRDHYVSPHLEEGLERWVPRLWRRPVEATHWSALLREGGTVARMVREFVAHTEGAEATPELARARRRPAEPTEVDRPFAGQLALVTGGGGGIGRATALALAQRGARVVVCDLDLEGARHTAELAAGLGGQAHAHRVDVSDQAAMDAFAERITEEHGVVDILVNNAGVGHSGPLMATTPDQWRRVLDVNLWGVIHGCRAFGSRMAERGQGGHIVNLASAAAYLPSKVMGPYATSKAGVLMLSDCLRAELAPTGVAVTAICPGVVNTGIVRTTTFSGVSEEEQRAKRERISGLYARRNYPPERVAEQIVRAIRRRKAVVPVTLEARAARLLSRLSPGALRLAARLNIT
ncbi:SDR family oxidoreductase [Streptomyces sp. NPDC005438]|uniref:SDR family oxidoreductase n=1 Tax=Streptomyces sp. NPDC005438 TaxID=3156880 RepID=UPI0033BB1062